MIGVALLGFALVLVATWVLRWVAAGVPALDVEDDEELREAELRAAGRAPRQWPKLVGRDW